jgi:hypothetical protein
MKSVPPLAPTIMLSHFPGILRARPDALVVNLEEKEGEGVTGWGWQDNAYFEDDSGDVRFEKSGVHTLLVQSREDGVAIDLVDPPQSGEPLAVEIGSTTGVRRRTRPPLLPGQEAGFNQGKDVPTPGCSAWKKSRPRPASGSSRTSPAGRKRKQA